MSGRSLPKHWPSSPSVCGTHLFNEVYPALEKRGVRIVPSKSSRTYELPR